MGCGSDFLSDLPDRFARSLPREAEQDHVYYHMQPDKRSSCVTGMNRSRRRRRINVLWRRSGRDKRKTAVSEKLGVTALYLNPVFKAPSVHNTIPRIIAMSIRSLAVMGRCAFATQYAAAGNAAGAGRRVYHSGDSHAWFDRHNRGTGGAVTTLNRPGATGTRLVMMARRRLAWLCQLAEAGLSVGKSGDEIYRGEDSIVRHWLKAPWSWTAGGWMWCICWGRRVGRAIYAARCWDHRSGERNPAGSVFVGEHFGDARQWLQADVEDAP